MKNNERNFQNGVNDVKQNTKEGKNNVLCNKKIFLVVIIMCIIQILSGISTVNAEANNDSIPEKYDLRDYIDLKVKNQGPNGDCVPTSISTTIESYVRLKQKNGELGFITEPPVFSMVPIDSTGYAKLIPTEDSDKVIKKFYSGEISTEDELALAYGETENPDLKFELSKIKTKYQMINKNGTKDSFENLVGIKKKIENGNVIYQNKARETIDSNQVDNIRKEIKKYIIENGGIESLVNISYIKRAKFCNTNENVDPNHGVVIIGWDDNYSRLNFPEPIRPHSDGAYIVQNSWGTVWGDNGVFYVSYEDVTIESSLNGIGQIVELDDKEAPIVKVEETTDNITVKITDNYGSGYKSGKYIWTEHNIEPNINSTGWINIEGDEFTVANDEEKYLWVYLEDNAGNGALRSIRYDKSDLQLYKTQNKVTVSHRNTGGNFEIAVNSDTLSENEINCEYKGDIYEIEILKAGKHTLYISEIIEKNGKKIEGKAQKIEIEVTNDIDRTGPKIKTKIERIQGTNEKVKVFIETTDNSGIIAIGLRKAEQTLFKGNYVLVDNEPQNETAEFIITENGDYFVWAEDAEGNFKEEQLVIDMIGKEFVDENENNENDNGDSGDNRNTGDTGNNGNNALVDDYENQSETDGKDDFDILKKLSNEGKGKNINQSDNDYDVSGTNKIDNTVANKILPQTGNSNLFIIIGVCVFVVIGLYLKKNISSKK